MNISFIVKASTSMGYGHLIRSRSLARSIDPLLHSEDKLALYIIGKPELKRLVANEHIDCVIFESEKAFIAQSDKLALQDIVIFDLLSVTDALFDITKQSRLKISISPIFSHLNKIDIFFHRTKYFDAELDKKVHVFQGLDYAVIQQGCMRIDAASYKEQLDEGRMSVAISMGGGDAANKSLQVIREMNLLENDYTIWLMLGEGYNHSYDLLIEESKNSHHEIILAKTNESMWRVLRQASLLILPGGVTSYEAAYAGLPTINILENADRRFIIRELVDANAAVEIADIDNQNLVGKIEYFNKNRKVLYDMHLNTKGLIDGQAANRIFEIIINRKSKM